MPYIEQEQRAKVDKQIDDLAAEIVSMTFGQDESVRGRDGILNYTITQLINRLYPVDKYSEFNEALGVLDAASKEFYRRRVAKYEDKKIEENGDVY